VTIEHSHGLLARGACSRNRRFTTRTICAYPGLSIKGRLQCSIELNLFVISSLAAPIFFAIIIVVIVFFFRVASEVAELIALR
jgi:hypothetical protein